MVYGAPRAYDDVTLKHINTILCCIFLQVVEYMNANEIQMLTTNNLIVQIIPGLDSYN